MSKKDYMKKNKIGEPLNDNIPIKILVQKNFAIGITTSALFQETSVTITKAKKIAYDAGTTARFVWNNLESIKAQAQSAENEES
jgi:hypothetical protein